MQNEEQWKPTKFEIRGGKLRHTKNIKYVMLSSRIAVDVVAAKYDEYLPTYAKGSLLDLGCGNAPLYHVYRDHAESITCIDWGGSQHENKHLDIEADISEPLEIANESFDTIILSDVLEHIPEPLQLFKEIHRILKPGGRLIMNVPFYYWLHEQPHDYYRYSEFALKRFCHESGLELEILESTGGAPEILADVFSKNIVSVPLIGAPICMAAQALTSLALKTKYGKNISNKTSKNFPFGYFLVAARQTSTA